METELKRKVREKKVKKGLTIVGGGALILEKRTGRGSQLRLFDKVDASGVQPKREKSGSRKIEEPDPLAKFLRRLGSRSKEEL